MTTPDKDTPLIFVVEDEADIARLIASAAEDLEQPPGQAKP